MQLSPISLAITRLGGVRFSPSALFSSGEQGAWYDPSDLTTLFQDSAGTTPVTAVEQPVGLVLDKSKGLVLGPELVTNGDFSQGSTGWTAGAGWSIAGGAATGAAASTNLLQTNVAPSPSGKTYRVTLTIVTRTAGSIVPAISGSSVTLTNPGTYTFYLFPTGSDATLYISGVGFTGTITNISVKALPGNHAYQTTSASRPTLRARYNLLTYSEQFDNAVWTKDSSTISANATTAPDGTNTADKVISTAVTAQIGVSQGFTAVATTYTASFSVKQAEVRYVQMLWSGGVSANYANFDLQTGTVTVASGGTATITAQANGFYRITLTSTLIAGATSAFLWMIPSGASGRAATYAGNGTDGFFVWGAQLTQTAVFPSNTYQQITTATSYATGAAFPPYLAFDGVDDSLLTNSVDFSATDKMTVWAGVTKSSDAARGMLLELSAVATNPGAFYVAAPDTNGTANYGMYLDPGAAYQPTTYTAPISNVISVAFNRAGATLADRVIPRINGIVNQTNPSTATPTGNFGNYPLYIGRRNNATLPLNGNIYSLIIRGAQSTAAQISSTESWVAAKTPLGSL